MSETDEIEMRIGLYPQSIHPLCDRSDTNSRNLPLSVVRTADGRLVIEVGVAVIASAALRHPDGPIAVTNQDGFADDIAAELMRDVDETGLSFIGRAIDDAMTRAFESGSEHAEEAKP